MVKKLDQLKKDVEQAIGQVAAEYAYAKDLQQQLLKIDNESTDKAIADARKGFRILRWVERAERKADHSEKIIINELQELGPILPQTLQDEEKRLLTQLKVAQSKLIRAASIFDGELKKQLTTIQTDQELLLKIKGQHTENIRSHLGAIATQAKAGVDDLLKWIAATEIILQQIEGFEKRLEQLAA